VGRAVAVTGTGLVATAAQASAAAGWARSEPIGKDRATRHDRPTQPVPRGEENGMGRLDGKVAIITGAARGQGAAEAALFAAEGATVVSTDVLVEEGERAAGEVGVEFLTHDISSEEGWESVIGYVVARYGRLDILVNNAAILQWGRIVNTSLEDYERIVTVNQTGTFLGLKYGGQAMIDAGNGGSIVNLSSIAGLEGQFGTVGYTASKWAVRGMTKVAAKEFGKSGIRVNSVHPGFIETPMVESSTILTRPETRARAERRIPLGRLGQPEDIAKLVLFLASDDSAYCSGQEFICDGGGYG
jgi:3alpha(or 20beta)-hydroxysteroid dehydrogenase